MVPRAHALRGTESNSVTAKVTKELLLWPLDCGEATSLVLDWRNGVEPKLEPRVHGCWSREDES